MLLWLAEDQLVDIIGQVPRKSRRGIWASCSLLRRLSLAVLGTDLDLHHEQVDAFLMAMAGHNVVITGGAGTGKSHLLRAIITNMPKSGLCVTASTGAAAALVGGTTLHSALGLGLGKQSVNGILHNLRDKYDTRNRLLDMQTLIVDEAFMLDAAIFDKAGGVLGNGQVMFARRGTSHFSQLMASAASQNPPPFGQTQVILCGDGLQLPPVSAADCGFVFESKAFNKLGFKIKVLKQVHRQADVAFSNVLNRIRVGQAAQADVDYLLANSSPGPVEDAIQLFCTNAPADALNDARLRALQSRLHSFHALDTSSLTMPVDRLDALLAHCPAPKLLLLKVGARVVCLRNLNNGIFNGSLGTVVSIEPSTHTPDGRVSTVSIRVCFDGVFGHPPVTHTFTTIESGANTAAEIPVTWTFPIGQMKKKVAQRVQIPLKLAWAISVHKSQGMSLASANVDLTGVFESGQAYTALSRLRSLDRAHFKNLRLRTVGAVNRTALKFYHSVDPDAVP